jgi:peptide/nickel transport system substrate-binding protein
MLRISSAPCAVRPPRVPPHEEEILRKTALQSVAVAGVIVTLVAGCSSSASQSPTSSTGASASTGAIKSGGELRMGIEGDPVAIDPAFSYDFTANPIVCEITEGLLKFQNGKVVPNLAESFTKVSDTVWKYNVRKDVKFSDGNPMTVEDVIYSWERTKSADTGSYVGWMFGSVASITKTGDWEITVTLSQPDALWQYIPATTAGHVIEKAYAEAHKDKLGKPEVGVIGTGPFKFSKWDTGKEVVLEKNANYWNSANGGPYLDKITFKVLPEATTRVAALQTGDLDGILSAIPGDQLPIVQKMGNVNLQLADSYLSDFIAFNTQRAPFNNTKVRQALNYAIDKVAVRKATLGDFATDSKSAITVGPWMAAVFEQSQWDALYPTLPTYAKDMTKAKQLLQESGVADQINGKVITTDENPVRMAQALALQAAAKELGYDLSIRKLTFAENISLSFGGSNRDYDIIISNWGSDFPDASGNLYPVYDSKNAGEGGANFGNFKNAQVDALLDAQNSSYDQVVRTQKMVEASKIIADETPLIVFDHAKWPLALNKNFAGYDMSPLWYWDAFATNIHSTK